MSVNESRIQRLPKSKCTEETKGLVGLMDWSRICGVWSAQHLNEELTKINIKRKLKLITTSRMVQMPETKTKDIQL